MIVNFHQYSSYFVRQKSRSLHAAFKSELQKSFYYRYEAIFGYQEKGIERNLKILYNL